MLQKDGCDYPTILSVIKLLANCHLVITEASALLYLHIISSLTNINTLMPKVWSFIYSVWRNSEEIISCPFSDSLITGCVSFDWRRLKVSCKHAASTSKSGFINNCSTWVVSILTIWSLCNNIHSVSILYLLTVRIWTTL